MLNTNKNIKSFKLFESEISWEYFWDFVQEVHDVFIDIMDDNLLINDNLGQYSFEYQDDSVFLEIKKSEDIMDLWQDIAISINRLKDKYNITYKVSDLPESIKIIINLESENN